MATHDPVDPDLSLEVGGRAIAPGDRLGPYIYRRIVGRGAMAHVLLATDPDGRQVALKVLKSGRVDAGLARFKREFRALARIRHPNVIRVDAYGDLWGHPYIAMEYVEGHDLHTAILGFRDLAPEVRWARCEAILVDLCRALAYIHRRGLVHRDLKPSNVLIDAGGRCKLTDFGIVKDLDPNHDAMLSNALVGTWAYASVEQMSGAPIDHRSDLYSLGVILFAMLTGRRPFTAKDLAGYLEVHRTHRAPAPRELDPRVPGHLDAICTRLLRTDPRERFRSAQDILYLLETRDAAHASHPAPDGDWVPPLVGREAEDGALRALVAALTRGEGGVAWVEGPEGVGRTRMLEITVDQAQAMGVPCVRETVPHGDAPLGCVLRLASSLAEELGSGAPADLAALLSGENAAALPREQVVEALVEGFRLLLEDGPAVLVVDDLHEAQVPAVSALTTLVERLGGAPLLVVVSARTDAARGRLAALRERAVRRILLGPLDRDAVAALVTQAVGPGRAAQVLTERLYRETEGNVLFLVLFLQNLLLAGMLERHGERLRLVADPDEIESGHVDVPLGVRQVVRARLGPLDSAQRAIVRVLAVFGQELDVDLLVDVLDRDEAELEAPLTALAGRGIVRRRSVGTQVRIAFSHAKFGDVTYRDMDDSERAALHRKVANALEARVSSVPSVAERVGEHYRRAGDSGRAYRYLAAAGRRFVARGMPAEALEVLGRAAAAEDGARVDLSASEVAGARTDLLVARAEIHAIRGEPAAAREAVDALLRLLADGLVGEEETMRARVVLGRVLRTLGELDAAEGQANLVLPRAQALHARDLVAEALIVLAGIAWNRGQLDACEARAQEGLAIATASAQLGQRARLLLALSSVQATRGQLAQAAGGLAEAQAIFKDLRMKPSRALALANLAEVMLGQGDVGTSWTHATEALAEARDATHGVGQIAAHDIRGHAALLVGAADVARAELDASVALSTAIEAPEEGIVGAMLLGRLALEGDDPAGALTRLDDAAARASHGDPERLGPILQALRAQALGRLLLAPGAASMPPAQRRAQEGAARDAFVAAEGPLPYLPLVRRAQCTLDLARARAIVGDLDTALTLARSAIHLASMRGLRLLALDALAVAAFVTPDDHERARWHQEIADYVAEIAPTLPVAWRPGFRRRLGLPPHG
jgi:tetratricopeptide (TPR) repeat protein